MTDEDKAAQPLDPMESAISIGHGAAVNVLVSLAPAEADPTFDPQCWPSFGNVRIEDETRDVVGELGRYVCSRDAPIGGETLYRKAAELGLHGGEPDGWRDQPDAVRLSYELFINATWHAYVYLQEAPAPTALPPRAKPAIEDTIFETDAGGLGERDQDMVAALDGMGTLTAEERAAAAASTEISAETLAAQPDGPLSVGERPIDMANQVKKRGGKRTRSAS